MLYSGAEVQICPSQVLTAIDAISAQIRRILAHRAEPASVTERDLLLQCEVFIRLVPPDRPTPFFGGVRGGSAGLGCRVAPRSAGDGDVDGRVAYLDRLACGVGVPPMPPPVWRPWPPSSIPAIRHRSGAPSRIRDMRRWPITRPMSCGRHAAGASAPTRATEGAIPRPPETE
jgi:hypothetical protein